MRIAVRDLESIFVGDWLWLGLCEAQSVTLE